MRLIDADKLPYEDIESVDGNTYMCVNAYDIEHAPTVEMVEDCISRAEAIRLAEQGQIQGYEWQFKKLCDLSSVTPQQKWIPVSEPPKETGEYLTTIKWLNRENVYRYMVVKRDYFAEVDTWNDSLVIAWMPLPQPYKAESEDKE